MTGPVWDGDGDDPWLPARLAAEAELVEAEQTVYRHFFAALSQWLVHVHRTVTRGPVPDPTAVFALAPEWQRAMRAFADGPIRDTIALAYAALFGDGYRFDSRPAVIAHLAEVVNRMVRTPDEVFDLIAGQISVGSGRGESIPELADRVDDVLSTTRTERWPNRAVVVARTETIGAMNAGRADAFAAVAEEVDDGTGFEQMWLATSDSRTRRTHRDADGQRVPVGGLFTVGTADLRYPGDPRGPAKEVIQCRCTTLLVRVGETVDLSNRQLVS